MERTYNNGRWTTGRFRGFIRATLRSATQRWAPKYEVLNEAKTTKKKNKKSGRLAQHYRCASCKKDFPKAEVQVDHIQPVVLDSFTTWDDFIDNLFCDSDNLQVLCVVCHKKKSKAERK